MEASGFLLFSNNFSRRKIMRTVGIIVNIDGHCEFHSVELGQIDYPKDYYRWRRQYAKYHQQSNKPQKITDILRQIFEKLGEYERAFQNKEINRLHHLEVTIEGLFFDISEFLLSNQKED